MSFNRTEASHEKRKEICMKINYNMSAKITNQQLLRTEDKMTAVMERLSSGFKLNHAKDNPSGMAISNKMILQIDGLSQSSKNASNGTSVMQTADGALSEVTDLIQRMRELSVQAASDSNTPDDRKAIQKEIDSLKQEVDRVSKDTEFNTKSLLDGSLGRRVYTTNATRVSVSGDVTAGNYSVTIDKAAEQAVMQADTAVFNDMTATVGVKGKITINDSIVNIEATDTYEEVFEKIRDGGEIGETIVKLDGDKLDFTSTAYGDTGMVKIEISDPALAGALGFAATEPAIAYGSNAEVDIHGAGSGFPETATAELRGNRVIITDRDGFSISFLTDSGLADGSTVDLEVTDMGMMQLQIGPNENQTMRVDIPKMSAEMLYLDDLDVTTVTGADRGIRALDEALAQVSGIRASLGAYENRLDYTIGSLDATGENMTQALSRIKDADMAVEMTEYTQQNVLAQAATSVLAQANDLPQQVLQLLQ